jgi:integrase/recombinase XerD
MSRKGLFTTFPEQLERKPFPVNIKSFLEYMRGRGKSPATIHSYRIELIKFQSYLREKKLRVNQVKPRDIEAYLHWRDPEGLSRPATTTRRIAVLHSFYSYVSAMANGHVRNPVEVIRYPKRQCPNPRPLSEEQVETLTHGIDNARDRAIIGLLLNSGLRVSELCSLDRDSVRVEHLSPEPNGKVVGVGRVMGKGDKEREFLVDLPTLKLIHQYLADRGQDGNPALFLSNRGRRIDKRSVQHMLHAHCRRLGLPPLHPHQLRATFATRLNKVGVPTLEISKLLGHAYLDTTMAYVKPDARKLRSEYFAAQEALNGQ